MKLLTFFFSWLCTARENGKRISFDGDDYYLFISLLLLLRLHRLLVRFFSINSNQRDFECLAPVMWKVSFGLFVCFSSTATSSSSLAFVFVHIIGMKTKHIEFSCAVCTYVCLFVWYSLFSFSPSLPLDRSVRLPVSLLLFAHSDFLLLLHSIH